MATVTVVPPPNPPRTATAPFVPRFLLERIQTWQGMDEPITPATAKAVAEILPKLRASLAPGGREAVSVEVAKLAKQADAFGIGTNSLRDATAGYIAVVGELPADLIPLAFHRAWSRHKYGMRLPLPGEVRETVQPEFDERVARVAKLEAMTRAKVEDEREMTADERRAGLSIVEQAMAKLRGGWS